MPNEVIKKEYEHRCDKTAQEGFLRIVGDSISNYWRIIYPGTYTIIPGVKFCPFCGEKLKEPDV